MSTREERRRDRSKRKLYFTSISELKSAHRELFSSTGSTSVVQRSFESAYTRDRLFLVEACLRVRADDPRLKEAAVRFFGELTSTYQGGTDFEVSVLSVRSKFML